MNANELKELCKQAGYLKVTDEEITELFKEIDRDGSGKIECDEFMAYMHVGDKIDSEARDTLLRIRKAHMKLNS